MSFTSTPQQKLLFAKMRHTQVQQEVAGRNLANIGVAGAKEEVVGAFKAKVTKGGNAAAPAVTSAGHLSGSKGDHGFKISLSKKNGEPSLTGNSINSEAQLLKLNEVATDFYRISQVIGGENKRSHLIAKFGSGK